MLRIAWITARTAAAGTVAIAAVAAFAAGENHASLHSIIPSQEATKLATHFVGESPRFLQSCTSSISA